MKIGQKLEHNLNSPFPKNILKFIIYKITLLIIKIIVLCNVLIIQNSRIYFISMKIELDFSILYLYNCENSQNILNNFQQKSLKVCGYLNYLRIYSFLLLQNMFHFSAITRNVYYRNCIYKY